MPGKTESELYAESNADFFHSDLRFQASKIAFHWALPWHLLRGKQGMKLKTNIAIANCNELRLLLRICGLYHISSDGRRNIADGH